MRTLKASAWSGVTRSGFTVRDDAVDELSSLLPRLSLAPIDGVPVERDLLETDRIADNKVGSYGRRPKTIRAGGHASRPVLASGHERHTAGRAASQLLARSMTCDIGTSDRIFLV